MEYIIEHQQYGGRYSRQEVQQLLDEKKINIDTKIWHEEWNEWKTIQDTDFDYSNASFEEGTALPDNIFLSARKYIDFIDKGELYHKAISWLYALIAIAILAYPLYLLYLAYSFDLTDMEIQSLISFIIIWTIIAFASWISFQLWWDRKSKVVSVIKNTEYKATPVISHFIQTIGEWLGIWVALVGFSVSLLATLLIGGTGSSSIHLIINTGILDPMILLGSNDGLLLSPIRTGVLYSLMMPVYGLLIIIFSRFLAEQFNAIISIATNTKKSKG